MTQLQEKLDSLTQANNLLLAKNKSLEEAMRVNEHKVVSHHMHRAITLSIHALCRGMVYTENRSHQQDRSPGNGLTRHNSEGVVKELTRHESAPTGSRSSNDLTSEEGRGEEFNPSQTSPEVQHNPLRSGHLQWWMVEKSAVKVSVDPYQIECRPFTSQSLL